MLYEDDPDQESFAVAEVMLHEDYDSWTINNDICLLKLDGSATMGENVATIGFPADMEEYEEGTECIVSGWGTTSEGGSLGRTLQKVGRLWMSGRWMLYVRMMDSGRQEAGCQEA